MPVTQQSSVNDKPAYYPLQRAFHSAFRRELYRLIDRLPAPDRPSILDVPCGDGFYARRLVRKIRAGGRLVLADASPGYLADARERLAGCPGEISAMLTDAYQLDLPASSFDLTWCGQSLISLGDHRRALAEFVRVTKSGGHVVVFETDEYHHVMLPWPVGLELAVSTAVAEAAKAKYGAAGKIAVSRTIGREMRAAGLQNVRRRTMAMDRQGPFGERERRFIGLHFRHLRELIRGRLDEERQQQFDRFTAADHPDSFLQSPSAEFACLTTMHLGEKR